MNFHTRFIVPNLAIKLLTMLTKWKIITPRSPPVHAANRMQFYVNSVCMRITDNFELGDYGHLLASAIRAKFAYLFKATSCKLQAL